MSAFLVNKETIDAIVTAHHALSGPEAEQLHAVARDAELEGRAADAAEIRARADADGALSALGAMLWRENARSVNYRYRRDDAAPTYEFEAVPLDGLTDGSLGRAHALLRCLRYQSCEWPSYADTRACAFIDDMLSRIELRVGARIGVLSVGWEANDRDVLTRDGVAAARYS